MPNSSMRPEYETLGVGVGSKEELNEEPDPVTSTKVGFEPSEHPTSAQETKTVTRE